MSFDVSIPGDGSRLQITGLELQPGRTTVIFGPNGAGKTTLLRYLVRELGASGTVAYIQQRPHMFRGSAGFNLGLGLDSEPASRARQLADRLGLSGLLEQPAPLLSGGEKHRLVLARTLARPADWYLFDEPMAPIDFAERREILSLLTSELEGRSAVVVSHDINVVAALADRVVILDKGKIVEQGDVSTVIGSPSFVRSAEILGKANLIDGHARPAGGLCVLEAGDVTITGMGDANGRARALFGAEAVTLRLAGAGHDISSRNTWIGRVESISPRAQLVEVTVDIGVKVVAVVTPGALEDLSIEVGAEIGVALKASAVTIVVT
ncbi:MAG: ATP-binding cassette domain-containing protein [Acidimicrobiia bacterium]